MKLKKLMSLGLAAAMVLTTAVTATGCGSKSSGKDDFTWWIYTTDGAGTYYEKYDDNPGIQWLNAQSWDVENGGIAKDDEEGTQVTLSFQNPIAGAEADNFNTMISTGEYPEIIDLSISSGVESLYEEGIAMDITEYVEKYMPNYVKLLDENPDIKARVTSTDEDGNTQYLKIAGFSNQGVGNMWGGYSYRRDWIVEYATPTEYVWDWDSAYVQQNGHPAVTPLSKAQSSGNLEGWKKNEVTSFTSNDGADPDNDYTDNVIFPSGKDYPYTVSDWEWMADAFSKAIAERSFAEDADAYPIGTYYQGYMAMGDLVSSFGNADGSVYTTKDGTAEYSAVSDDFKNYIDAMNTWYKNGWLDSKFETRSSEIFFETNKNGMTQGKVGLWWGTIGTLGKTIRATCADATDAKNAYVMGCPSPINDMYGTDAQKFVEPSAMYQDSRVGSGICITDKAKDKDLAALFTMFDYFYTDEGNCLICMGLNEEQYKSTKIENDLYKEAGITSAYTIEQHDDGTFTYVLNVDGSNDICNAIKPMRLGLGYNRIANPSDGSYTYDEGHTEVVKTAQILYASYKNTGYPLQYSTLFTDAESKLDNKLTNNSNDIISTKVPNMIKNGTGNGAWDEYVGLLEDLNPEEVLKAYQRVADLLNGK